MANEQVFISYKSEEIDEALWVKEHLEAHGIACWMAYTSITGGASYATEISSAISDCPVFVLLLSRQAQQSKIIPKELDQAISEGKIVMPFALDNCPLEDDFMFYLRNVQYYYGYKDKDAAMAKMLRDIRSKLEPPKFCASKRSRSHTSKAPSEARNSQKKHIRQAGHPRTKNAQLRHIFLTVVGTLASRLMILFFDITRQVIFADEVFKKSCYMIRLQKKIITYDDMQKLFQFKELYAIELIDCTFKTNDLSAFSCQPLDTLTLINCSLSDKQLQSIPFHSMELYTLNLSKNEKLTDLSVIAPLAGNLRTLSIQNANVTDLSVLSTFTKLSELDVSNNKSLTDLSPIVHLADILTSLVISNTGVTNLNDLTTFTKLAQLGISNLNLLTLAPLRRMVYLDTLIADGNRLTDLTGLENTTILKRVFLNNNHLENVDHLANSAATLREVYLDCNELTDLRCLSNCTKITAFSAKRNNLTSIDWTYKWTHINYLSASDNQIEFINHFPPGNKLKYLDLSGNNLSEFTGLNSASYDATLNLSNNRLNTVVLPKSYYKQIILHGNPLKSLDFVKGLTLNWLSIDYFDGLNAKAIQDIRTSTYLYYHSTSIYIIDCPLNHIVELEQACSGVKVLKRSQIDKQMPDPDFFDD